MKNSLFYIPALVLVSFFSLTSYAETINLVFRDNVAPSYVRTDKKGLTNEMVSMSDRDSVLVYTRGANGLIIVPPVGWDAFPYNVSFRDTVIYDPQFLPVVFDGKILPPRLNFVPRDSKIESPKFHLIPEDETFAPLIQRAEVVQDRRRNFYMNMSNIGDVQYNASVLKSIPKLNEEDATKRSFINDLIATDDAVRITPVEIEKIKPGYIYWVKHGDHTLEAAQNYISDNWNSGGNRNYTIRNAHRLTLNYKKDKVTFDNTMEWRLNLQSTPADKLHDVNISEDLFRLENILGYRAFNKWSYSTRLETSTKFFNSYPVNSNQRNSSFLSPLVMDLSIGLGYKLDKNFKSDKRKKLSFNLNLSPLSMRYNYVRDDKVDETRYGVPKGDRALLEIGSQINSNLTFDFNRYMTWTSRFKYFTNYERTLVEFENTFAMRFTRLLGATINLNARFDDNVVRDKKLGYLQVNELVSFGLNYKW